MSLKTKWTSGTLFVFLFLTSFWFGLGMLGNGFYKHFPSKDMSKKPRLTESLDSQLTQSTESVIRPTWCGSITPWDNRTTQ